MSKIKWNRETLKQLAKELGVPVEELVAGHTTNDPFYLVSTDSEKRAKWFKALFDKAKAQAPHVVPHLRRLHYFALSLPGFTRLDGKPYKNDDATWTYLSRASTYARYMGLIGFKDITDRRNPEAKVNIDSVDHVEYGGHNRLEFEGKPTDLDYRVGYIHGNNAEELAEALAKAERDDVGASIFYNVDKLQPYHLEVWCEKSTMNEEIEPVCRQFRANFVPGLGEESITRVDDFMDRAIESEKPVRIFYICDYDPQGVCIPEAVGRKIQFFNEYFHGNDLDVKLFHLALTEEQIGHYDLPKNPTKVERHPFATELDALEALHPGELSKILTEALAPYVDLKLASKVSVAIGDFQEEIYSHVQEAVMENEDKINKLIQDYNHYYREVNETLGQLHEKVVELHKQTEPIGKDIVELQNESLNLEGLEIELPEANVEEESDKQWLYDSTLDYLEQTKRLKQHSKRE